ncbi:2Fe-2S iron-sulfur cluster-binding protein [Glutamicibacter creatinolyticus]|uniref:2Fe-2S iron-sulfur cluster-binding protein n=1 Tax=Glutamicibacter creatinolyticus TaxID=162496 RepID=UPI003B982C17
MGHQLHFTVDGQEHTLPLDPRTTLLDALRDRLGVMSAKKGCDHGQCGACTVLVNGRRLNSCLALAPSYDGAEITTADGLTEAGELSGLHRAFLKQDAFQCGYCTPGQVCSAAGVIQEAADQAPSVVTEDLQAPVELTDAEIRERMSGNLCRCGAYINIVAAVRQAAEDPR